MRRLIWLLLLSIVTQMGAGTLWASPLAVAVQVVAPDTAANKASPHAPCHAEGGASLHTDTAAANSDIPVQPVAPDQAHCGSHCHFCCAIGMPMALAPHQNLLPESVQVPSAVALVSWTHAPELRPPI